MPPQLLFETLLEMLCETLDAEHPILNLLVDFDLVLLYDQ